MNSEYKRNKFIKKAIKKYGKSRFGYSKVNYVDCFTEVTIIDNRTHKDFNITPTKFLNTNCFGKKKNQKNTDSFNEEKRKCKRRTTSTFIEEAKQIHENKYEYSKTQFINLSKNIIVTCPIHGDFEITPMSHLKFKMGCPICRNVYKHIAKTSRLEKDIADFLTENKISFIPQYKFDWLKYKNKMSLDFYLPDYNVAIECQGGQHFSALNFFGNYEKCSDIIKRDVAKLNLCVEHEVKLLHYTDNINIPKNWILYDVIQDKDELLNKIKDKSYKVSRINDWKKVKEWLKKKRLIPKDDNIKIKQCYNFYPLRSLSTKAVACYNDNGDLLQTFNSINDAAIAVNIKPLRILNCCTKQDKYTKTAGGLRWAFLGEEPNLEKATEGKKAIYRLDLNTGAIQEEFPSVKQAAVKYDISRNDITHCLKHRKSSFKGAIWVYKDEYPNLDIQKLVDVAKKETNEKYFVGKPYRKMSKTEKVKRVALNRRYKNELQKIQVLQIDAFTDEIIREYDSLREAADAMESTYNTISLVCKGVKKMYKGYKWKFKEIDPIDRVLNYIWSDTKNKCYDEEDKRYRKHGAKGVKMCEGWKNNYQTFKEWSLNNGFVCENKLILDRIDTEGDYEPSNCRWIDSTLQSKIKKPKILYEYNGEMKTIPQLAKEHGILKETLRNRIKRGEPQENWFVKGRIK